MKGFHGGMSEEKTGSMDPWVKQQFFEMIQQKCVMLFLWKYSTIRADYNDYDNGFSLTKFDNNTTAYIQAGRTAACSCIRHIWTERRNILVHRRSLKLGCDFFCITGKFCGILIIRTLYRREVY